jgi:Arc/MetJ-type ribon-helix-helix transcriptional regulator
MAETEKITVNLNLVDLGNMDILVEQGFYSNRADLIRTAIRNQLGQHSDDVKQIVSKKMMTIGVMRLNSENLQEEIALGRQLNLRVLGMLVIGNDVTPELASKTIQSILVKGVYRAPQGVMEALAGRMIQ